MFYNQGFESDRKAALNAITFTSNSKDMRAPFADIILLWYSAIASPLFGTSEADVIFASTLRRAIETAEAVAGGKTISTDAVFIEAPLPPPPVLGRRTPRAWGVWARVFWWFGRHAGQETRQEAEQRAEAAVATVTARALRGDNVLVCAHGWFNRMMRPVLRAQGWKCVEDHGDGYWSYRRYIKAH